MSILIYMYRSYIIIQRICSIYKVSLTWDLKPRTLVLCSNVCSTELASQAQESSTQSISIQEVASKNTNLCMNVGNWAGLSAT